MFGWNIGILFVLFIGTCWNQSVAVGIIVIYIIVIVYVRSTITMSSCQDTLKGKLSCIYFDLTEQMLTKLSLHLTEQICHQPLTEDI